MALDRHSAGSDHPASTNKTTIQTTLDAINCILLECGILKNLGADAQRSDKRVEETEATASSAAGDTLDHSTGLNLDNLSIANETALDTRDGMPDIEQQSPFQLSQEEEWEREQVMSHRNRRYILAAKDLEGRLPSVDSLFAQPVQWDYVDATLLQAEVEPVVKMLLLEYLGGDADDGSVADLVEFVIGHLRDHKSPQSLVEELEMVLVDEAPAFVAQIWRVLLSTAEPNALPQS
ncbi:hypothetical protein H4R26_004260 [Coemansia thaxteri]|uniref:PWI domain-containing protein n=1 Tax=Coemansia thaxteri TaxID=2663907 RepID=A0A9W8BBG5_9FUNG|nr:hypothetical protein H4R26_004260 [Coemansia thaxteri]